MTAELFGDGDGGGNTKNGRDNNTPGVELRTGRLTRDKFDLYYGGAGVDRGGGDDNDNNRNTGDYRVVLVWRNIYDALISGYLYHREGKECWLTSYGEPVVDGIDNEDNDEPTSRRRKRKVGKPNKRRWDRFVSFDLDPPRSNRTLCQYLVDESLEVGMRTYLDYVFNDRYSGILSHWALGRGMPNSTIAKRSATVCYENLNAGASRRRDDTVDWMLQFWYGGGGNENNDEPDPDTTNTAAVMRWREEYRRRNRLLANNDASFAGHSTKKDPGTVRLLRDVIRRLDEWYYNGDVAWLNSVMPCGGGAETHPRVWQLQ